MIWEMCREIFAYSLVALDFKVLFKTELFHLCGPFYIIIVVKTCSCHDP